jgi:hypothetical protein
LYLVLGVLYLFLVARVIQSGPEETDLASIGTGGADPC